MEVNLHYQVCGKMPKTDKVGFHFVLIIAKRSNTELDTRNTGQNFRQWSKNWSPYSTPVRNEVIRKTTFTVN